jgi:hypothetical protein
MEILCVLFSVIQNMMREDSGAVKKMPYATECSYFLPHIVASVERGGNSGKQTDFDER